MNNKVKFLRGTSDEYAVAEKDNDTIYFTTDDGKLYIGDKEVSGSDITIDDTLSDTSTNPVQNKIVKQAIDNKADKSLYSDTAINVGRKADTTVGRNSTAEGYNTTASGLYSHAEGAYTTASGNYSHAEGYNTTASGGYSHAEGYKTTSSGDYSHAEGFHTKALKEAEFAHGKFNQSNSDTLYSIGDGTAEDERHNAFEITTTGGKLHDKDIATTDLIPTTLPANGGNADSADTLTDWGTRTVTNANDAPFGFCAALDCENAPNTFWSTILTTGSSGATSYKTQIAFPWAFGAGENRIRYRCENDGEWGSWQEISTTPIKSTTFSGTTDANGNLMLWAASENKIPICAILTVYFSSIFYYSPNGKYYLGVTDINTHAYSPNVSVGGTVYYIEQG